MLGYWAFQAWGNDPDLYSKDFIQNITKYLKKNDDNVDNVVVNETKSFEDYIWNFHRWTFVAPTIPCSIFLDCRTQRHYDSLAGPPQLLNEEELHSIEQALLHANYKNGDTLIMVPPTPVFGFDLAEELQKYLASKSNVYKWDLETWSANERGFVQLSYIYYSEPRTTSLHLFVWRCSLWFYYKCFVYAFTKKEVWKRRFTHCL